MFNVGLKMDRKLT